MHISTMVLVLALALLPVPGLCADSSAQAAAASDDLVVKADEMVAQLDEYSTEAREYLKEFHDSRGEDRRLAGSQVLEVESDLRKLLDKLLDNIDKQREDGLKVDKYVAAAKKHVQAQSSVLVMEVNLVNESMDKRRAGREKTPADGLLELEQLLSRNGAVGDRLMGALLTNTKRAQRLGLDPAAATKFLHKELERRATDTSARVRLVLEKIADFNDRLAKVSEGERSSIESQGSVLQERKVGTTASLQTTVTMMKDLGLETAEYSQLLVRATGKINEQIFDRQVVLGLFSQWLDEAREWLIDNGPGFVVQALVILVILAFFKFLSHVARRVAARTMTASNLNISRLLRDFFVSVASKLVMLVGVLIALSQLGFEIGPLLAGLGVAGFIIGFALQDTLANFASGMMILVYRPFDVGDVIEAGGTVGTVKEMSLVSTTVLTFDNQRLIVPNKKIWGDTIQNVTSETTRRVDLVFGIGYSEDIEQAEQVLRDIVVTHELVLDDPQPTIEVHNLGDSSVDFIVRPWVRTADYWRVYWDLTRSVKLRFDKEGISIPFPQRDVHIYNTAAAGALDAASGPAGA